MIADVSDCGPIHLGFLFGCRLALLSDLKGYHLLGI